MPTFDQLAAGGVSHQSLVIWSVADGIALFEMEPGPRTAWINEDIAPTPIRKL